MSELPGHLNAFERCRVLPTPRQPMTGRVSDIRLRPIPDLLTYSDY